MICLACGTTVDAMQTMVAVGADTVWAEDSGWPESSDSEPVLVLLHEGVGDSRMWDPIWPELTAAYRTIRYDVRGYGLSPAATQNYTLLGDLITVLDHFGVTPAHFAGCSMGGGTALEFAVTQPGRAKSLVLLCPGVGGYPYPDEPEPSTRNSRHWSRPATTRELRDCRSAYGLRPGTIPSSPT